MCVKLRKSGSAIQYLSVVLFLLCSPLYCQIKEMIGFGLEVADAVNQTLLDITALSDQEETLIGQELKQKILNQKKKGYPEHYK